jgi:hypothetical protein
VGRASGGSLVAAAESLLANAGCGLLEITSNVRLTEAHSFYCHLGYEQTIFRFAKGAGVGRLTSGRQRLTNRPIDSAS